MTSDTASMLAACIANPQEATPRALMQDMLREYDAWTHNTVHGYVLAHPQSDACRLLYADWCESEGDHDRAEFIRVQCELAMMPVHDFTRMGEYMGHPMVSCSACMKQHSGKCSRCQRQDRERELLGKFPVCSPSRPHWGLWSAPLWNTGIMLGRVWHEVITFRRGFVERIRCDWNAWAQHADTVTAAQPIRELVLTTLPDVDSDDSLEHASLVGHSVSVPLADYFPGGTRWGSPPLEALVKDLLKIRWPTITVTLPGNIATPTLNVGEWTYDPNATISTEGFNDASPDMV